VVFGTGGFGTNETGYGDKEGIKRIFEELKKHNVHHLETARVYGAGTSEKLLAELDYAGNGFIVDTKLTIGPGSGKADKLAESLKQSLEALKTNKVHTYYLHSPDRTTPYEETLEAVNKAYTQGHFEKFGLSNFSAAEVEQIVKLTKEKGWVQPSVYQGLYNIVARAGETELFPILRKHNIAFYAYSTLGGSFLTQGVNKDFQPPPNSRFDPNTQVGQIYRQHFYKDSYFQALEKLKASAAENGITVEEFVLRWIVHHSILKDEHHDRIILGGSTFERIQKALEYTEQPPLPSQLVKVADEMWELVKGEAAAYSR